MTRKTIPSCVRLQVLERDKRACQYIMTDEVKNRIEQYQSELDRYFVEYRQPAKCGELYERYIGYRLEMQGYEVKYHGISCAKNKIPDDGIDLICQRDKKTLIIQCKYRNKTNTGFSGNVIRDLFGAVYIYKIEHNDTEVSGQFTTSGYFLSDAEDTAAKLNIGLQGLEYMPKVFPIIKCKKNYEGKNCYFLPKDNFYDSVEINTKNGDLYCETVEEAELAGFSRCYRNEGNQVKELSKNQVDISYLKEVQDLNVERAKQQGII